MSTTNKMTDTFTTEEEHYHEWELYCKDCNQNNEKMDLETFEVGCNKCGYNMGACCCKYPLLRKVRKEYGTANPHAKYANPTEIKIKALAYSMRVWLDEQYDAKPDDMEEREAVYKEIMTLIYKKTNKRPYNRLLKEMKVMQKWGVIDPILAMRIFKEYGYDTFLRLGQELDIDSCDSASFSWVMNEFGW